MRLGRFHVDSRHLSIDAYVISAPLCCQPAASVCVFWGRRGGCSVGLRVREVADPKGRCTGADRPRWILETPRSALPGPCQLLGRRRGVAGRSRRRSCVRGSASPPSWSCLRRACSGSRHGLRCRVGSGSSRRCGSLWSSDGCRLGRDGGERSHPRTPRSGRCRSRTRAASDRHRPLAVVDVRAEVTGLQMHRIISLREP